MQTRRRDSPRVPSTTDSPRARCALMVWLLLHAVGCTATVATAATLPVPEFKDWFTPRLHMPTHHGLQADGMQVRELSAST